MNNIKIEDDAFQKMNDDELALKEMSYQIRLAPVLNDPRCLNSKKKFFTLLGKKGINFSTAELENFYLCVREVIMRQLKNLAITQYIYMKKTGNWGIAGEERITISFARCILNIPDEESVNHFTKDKFDLEIDFLEGKLGLIDKNPDQILESIINYKLRLLGCFYYLNRKELPAFLEKINSPDMLFLFDERGVPAFIFGRSQKKKIHSINKYVIIDEHIRSPLKHLSVVASGYGNDNFLIRQTSMNVIFSTKYENYFCTPLHERFRISLNADLAIYEGLIKKIFLFRGINDIFQLNKKREVFIKDAMQLVEKHELGHVLGKEDRPVIHESMIAGNYKTYNIIECLEEGIAELHPDATADWLIRLSRKHKKRATSNYYMLLADAYFAYESSSFNLLTDILCGILFQYINDDGSVDFLRLEQDLAGLYTFCQMQKSDIYDKLLKIIRMGKYFIAGQILSYEELQEYILAMYKSTGTVMKIEDLELSYDYWVNMLNYSSKFSSEVSEKLNQLLQNEAKNVEKKILSFSEESRVFTTLREFIHAKALKAGIMEHVQIADFSLAVQKVAACQELSLSEINNINDCINKLYDDDVYEFQSGFDPFVFFLQHMIEKSGVANLNDPIPVFFSFIAQERNQKYYIKKFEEEIVSSLEEDLAEICTGLSAVELSKTVDVEINENLKHIDILKKIYLNKKLFFKQVNFTFSKLPRGLLLRVSVPHKPGFVDMNTWMAIQKINNQIYEYSFDFFRYQYSISLLFLHVLTSGYLDKIENGDEI